MNIRLKCFAIYLNNKEKIGVLDDLNHSSRKDLSSQQSDS